MSTISSGNYLLPNVAEEMERLRLQARVLEPEAQAMLDRIHIEEGWNCIDLGCGGMGILGPLSKRVGPKGKVVGVDLDPKQLDAARAYVEQERLKNVEVLQRDAYNTGLPKASFDFVHARFILTPLGRDNDLLHEMSALTRPGGIMASEEPDGSSWNCYPPNINWDTLKNAIIHIFSFGGGDFNAERKTYALLRQARLEDVRIRAVVLPPGKRTSIHTTANTIGNILAAAHFRRRPADGGRAGLCC